MMTPLLSAAGLVLAAALVTAVIALLLAWAGRPDHPDIDRLADPDDPMYDVPPRAPSESEWDDLPRWPGGR